MANVLALRFEILRHSNHTCLPYDSSSPGHKGTSRPSYYLPYDFSLSFSYILAPRTITIIYPFFLTFPYLIPSPVSLPIASDYTRFYDTEKEEPRGVLSPGKRKGLKELYIKDKRLYN